MQGLTDFHKAGREFLSYSDAESEAQLASQGIQTTPLKAGPLVLIAPLRAREEKNSPVILTE